MPHRLPGTATSSRLLRAAVIAGCVAACRGGTDTSPAPPPGSAEVDARGDAAPAAPRIRCRPADFARTIPVKEASGATYIPATGKRPASLLVVGDSDTRGAFVELDPTTGRTTHKGRLPLDEGASDDLEGLSWRAGTLFGLTSSGYLRHWRRTDDTWTLAVPSYSIAAGKRPGKHDCVSPHRTNCGPNYEGLCLHQRVRGTTGGKRKHRTCVGFAASKARGTLMCLVLRKRGRLAVDPSRVLHVAAPGVLSGCHFGPGGDLLWAAGNMFGGGMVSVIEGWEEPETAKIRPVGHFGRGFPEAVAVVDGGWLYRFSDTMTAPSLADRYKCE